MKTKKLVLISTMTALALGMGGSVTAFQDEDEKKDKMLLDPMTRAEMQCAQLRAEAANGTEDDKIVAEKKCQQAIEYAKEMIKKQKKPDPDQDPDQ